MIGEMMSDECGMMNAGKENGRRGMPFPLW
jgi:hypothetical protein